MRHNEMSLGYMPTLDGLRGLACILVFMTHLDQLLDLNIYNERLGSLGVLIFFSLSGFLMGALYFSARCDYDHASKYVISRVSRIVPAYYIAIIFGWILYLTLPGYNQEMTLINVLRAFMFIGSEGVFWSIPPEIQFYAFFLLMWISYALSVNGRYLLLIMTLLISVSFILTRENWGGILLPSKFHIFLFGFFGAILMKELAFRKISIPAWAQLLLCGLCLVFYGYDVPKDELYNNVPYAALVALTVMSLSVNTIFTWVLKTPPMRFLGAASFSVYLFHLPVMMVFEHWISDRNSYLMYIVPISGLALPLAFHVLVERRLNVKMKDSMSGLNEKIKAKLTAAGFLRAKI